MKIDASHRPWALAFAIILAFAAIAYVPYTLLYPEGPGGNTIPGLSYGILGYGMMLFAGLLGARKKVPLWRIGRAQVWMRGHLWLGALSLPMILFHSAFRARGPLTLLMMILLYAVVLSGLTGAVLQHYLPRRILADVPLETIYEDLPTAREHLRQEAAAIVDKLCAEPLRATAAHSDTGRAVAVEDEEPAIELTEEQRNNLRDVYLTGIAPYLRRSASDAELANPGKSRLFFEALRRQCPEPAHEYINDIESICEEARQLNHQRRMYLALHGWLLVHVPLSITLLALGAIHAAVAVRY